MYNYKDYIKIKIKRNSRDKGAEEQWERENMKDVFKPLFTAIV